MAAERHASTSTPGRAKKPSGRRRAKAPEGVEPDGARDDSRNLVNSLAKGLRVLEAFSAERPKLTLSEVAGAADIDPGTAFRMLNTLVNLGYVTRTSGDRRFRLTLKVVDLGLNAIGRADLSEVARPILRSLVGEVSEAASLGVLDGGDVLYIERVRAGLTRLAVDIRIGTTVPAFCSVIGQAMLAYLPPRDLARVLAIAPRPGGMPAKSLSKAEITRSLDEVRERGYALRNSYFRDGLRILAVPVLDVDRYPLAAVSVAAPAVMVSMEDLCTHALKPVHAAAADIARAIRASGTVSATG